MLISEINQLLEPGYLPLETGYHRLSNGQMHVAVLTRMPGCTGKMIDGWFSRLSEAGVLGMRADKKPTLPYSIEYHSLRHHLDENRILEGAFGWPPARVTIHFHNPAEFLDASRFEDAKIGTALCANVYDLEKVPLGRFVHLVRDLDFGCELRSRFWLFHATDMEAMRLMHHCIEEMGRLADFLPDLYMQKNSQIDWLERLNSPIKKSTDKPR